MHKVLLYRSSILHKNQWLCIEYSWMFYERLIRIENYLEKAIIWSLVVIMYSQNVQGEQLLIYLDKVCMATSKNSYNHCAYSSQCNFKYSLMHFWKNKLNTCASYWFYKPFLMSTSNVPFVQFKRISSEFLRLLENYIEYIIILL